MYLSVKDYYLEITRNLNSSVKSIWIATYNMYPGITKDGTNVREAYNVPNATAEILDVLEENKITCNVICGLPPLIHCNDEYCENCDKKWKGIIERYKNTAENWKHINWKFCNESHLKYFIIEYEDQSSVCFVGSRNLTDSNWTEIMIKLHKKESDALLKVAKLMWHHINSVNLSKL